VKIRLHGTEQECAKAAALLPECFEIDAISRPYPDRGKSHLVRLYVDVRFREPENSRKKLRARFKARILIKNAPAARY
jgi:hypothetical protein